MAATEEARNKETVERFNAGVNSGDPEVIAATFEELVAPDARIRTPLPIDASGPEMLGQVFAMLRRAYPDLRVTAEDLIAEGDRVVSRNVVTGTHQGEYMGIAPTGKSVSYEEIFVMRFADGRIVETWGVVDVLGQLRQLGAAPQIGLTK